MKLYHFTAPDCLASIRERGLLPRANLRPSDMANGESVVWLTQMSDTRMTAAESALWTEWSGERTNLWFGFDTEPLARLMVKLGTHDRKLVRYLAWARKYEALAPRDLLITTSSGRLNTKAVIIYRRHVG